ncbi:lecithin retinol acyltransferase family protein [Pandoraea terrae]|nr:lecithin retinol acyltransferase family protein [Pandoraea terrae]
MGSHLITPRPSYLHHGIYAGNGRVVHYAGLSRSLCHGPVEEVSIASFAAGQGVWIMPGVAPKYPGHEAVRRARSRLGENSYRLLTNNCEHLCTWSLYGESRSEQVEWYVTHPTAVVRAVAQLLLAFFGSNSRSCQLEMA